MSVYYLYVDVGTRGISNVKQAIFCGIFLNFFVECFVFFITQALLFWFGYKYYFRKGRKAYWYPHNNSLELAWTIVPATVLILLITLQFEGWKKLNALKINLCGGLGNQLFQIFNGISFSLTHNIDFKLPESPIEFKQFQKTGWSCGLSCPVRGWVYVGCLKIL